MVSRIDAHGSDAGCDRCKKVAGGLDGHDESTDCRAVSLQWHNAVVSNVNAYNADVNDGAACMSPYEPEHNTDMLIYAANMAGEASQRLSLAY